MVEEKGVVCQNCGVVSKTVQYVQIGNCYVLYCSGCAQSTTARGDGYKA